MNRIDAETVRHALTPAMVLDHHGIRYKRAGDELRTQHCPSCGQRTRPSVAINAATGAWSCHAHGCHGGLFAAVAGFAGLDIAKEYPRVIEHAAAIAGITAELDPEMERRIAERRRIDEERRRKDEAEREAAIAAMPGRWNALDRRSIAGEQYLAGRKLDPAELRGRGDLLRYSTSGELALPMRDIETSAIVGIQYRGSGAKRFRTEPHSDASSSALVGRLTDLDPEGVDVAILVEGLADTIAASLAFPGCAVFGAPGCEHLERIARAIAPRIIACRGWLLIVPDNDIGGATHAGAAILAAEGAGLALDRDLFVIDLGEHHDLADAWAAGWRWSWPSIGGAS